jgi:branched-chain amino acid transport system substrate-binding protein
MNALKRISFVVLLITMATWIWAPPQAMSAGPIKIGFMAPYVGVYTKLGIDMDRGFKLYLDEVAWKAGGRKIEVIKSDTEGKPSLGPIKAKELVEKDKVNLLAGIVHSGVALSIRDYVTEKKMPLIITNAGAPALTAAKKSPYIFRVSFANGQQDLAGGWYIYNKAGFKKMMVLAPDYSAGHDKANGFMKYFKQSGGTVAKEIYPPLGTQDFAPYLAEVRKMAKDANGTWAFFAGSDSIRFVTQYAEFGLKKPLPLFTVGDTLDDAFFPSMGDAALGCRDYTHYCISINNPENKKFVPAYQKKYGEDPSMFSEQGYIGAKAIVEAINAIGGKVEDSQSFVAALRKVSFAAPRGPFKFDANQNVVENVYITKVEKVGDRILNVVKDVIPNVDQNWKPK